MICSALAMWSGLPRAPCSHGSLVPGRCRLLTREAGEARLGPRAAAGGAFVADLAAGAGAGARKRRDRRRVVVRFHLHQHVRGLGARFVQRRVGEAARQPSARWGRLASPRRCRCRPRSCAAGDVFSVWRIIWNIECSCASPSIVNRALKILWRQCSLLACANIISSTSVGLRCRLLERVEQVVDLVVAERQAEFGVGAARAPRGPAPSTSTCAIGCAGCASNRCAAASLSNATLSVMRSCSSAAQAAARRRSAAWRRPAGRLELQAVFGDALDAPHGSAQLCAMSVALLAQGDTVPRRGITTTSAPRAGRCSARRCRAAP